MSSLGQARWLGLPVSVYITTLIVILLWWVMKWTRLGRHIYAIGGNNRAARVSGVRVDLYTIITYTLCGLLAAMTGVLLTARIGSGEGTMGGEFIMESIAAAVLGGVAIGGGVGRAQFVAVGAVFLTLVTNGMNLLRVDSKLQTIVIGVILVIGIALDRFRRGPKRDGGLAE
jgi:ribose transport system permease protein